MDNVVTLPDSMQRQWRVYELGLGDHLRKYGCAADEVAHVLESLKPVFLQYATQNLTTTVNPADPGAVVRELNAWVHGIVSGLLEEVAAREVRLYRLGSTG